MFKEGVTTRDGEGHGVLLTKAWDEVAAARTSFAVVHLRRDPFEPAPTESVGGPQKRPVECQNWITSRDQVIFVDQAAEHITAADVPRGLQNRLGRPRSLLGW
jgi:hypothetical protein